MSRHFMMISVGVYETSICDELCHQTRALNVYFDTDSYEYCVAFIPLSIKHIENIFNLNFRTKRVLRYTPINSVL
jgi:hypothetical protein